MSKVKIAEVNDVYASKYAGRGLAPRHVAGLKEAMAKAHKKGEPMANAAKQFFKDKGITLEAAKPKASGKAPTTKKVAGKRGKKTSDDSEGN